MVGVLGLGSRHTSPADRIRRSDTSGSIASTRPVLSSPPDRTLSASISDCRHNTSGNFFSLPHWTRRILPVSSARKSLTGSPLPDEHSAKLRSTHRLLLEKDLPPTPSPCSDVSHDQSAQLNDAQVPISVQHASDTPPQPTFYLDVYHNTPMTSPPPQMNSIEFTSLPNRSRESALRKTKSTHSLRPEQSSSDQQRRIRGISMTQMFTTTKPSPPTIGNLPDVPLARKSSFWSRKSTPQHLTVPSGSSSPPVLNPTSPLRMGFTPPLDSFTRSRSSSTGTKLSTRRSERAACQLPIPRTNIPGSLQRHVSPDQINVRPSTADPHFLVSHCPPIRRPTTADSATPSRSRSLFALSKQSTLSDTNDQVLVADVTPQSQIGSIPRPRSSTNPPLLHRLSVNLFSSSSSSATKSGTILSNGAVSSPISRSPRPSLSQIPLDVIKPRVSESSESFLHRLLPLVSKADILGVLASTGDSTHVDSLKLFLERFAFHGDPLDVALRRLLMDVGLPRETQQIDRVIQAFADRYLLCNPDLFNSNDHPYILAFSLIMLHTDAFNKSNRRKMSKADYMKNTTLPGLIPEVLDCFYDNIIFAPFIFIEDPSDPEASVEGNSTRPSTSSGLPSPLMQSGSILLSRPKIDPYYLITHNLLDQLRVGVEGQISMENPFRWDGTGASWDYDEILLDFIKGHVVQVASVDVRLTTPFFGLSVGGNPAPPVNGNAPEPPFVSETWTLKFSMVAVLNRKDELLGGGKKPSNRKWRPYGVALTRSQLLLFRDPSWPATLLSWHGPPMKPPIPSTSFKPDETISLKDALAVLDRSYDKHLNTFRLATNDGRLILFQTNEENEVNKWISHINYASAFKTAGIRMRSIGMASKVLELTGVAAATSHLHDLRYSSTGQPRTLIWSHHHQPKPVDDLPDESCDRCSVNMDGRKIEYVDVSAPEVEGASQLEETFEKVKAELAVAHINTGGRSVAEKTHPTRPEPSRHTSRSHMIHNQVEDLENRICAANAQIDSCMHTARNLAILAPFQKSTRDRLQDTIQTLSKKIRVMRLDVTKLVCHRNILLNDFAVEERNFQQATSLALQVATETLQQRFSEHTSQPSISIQEYRHSSWFQEDTYPAGLQSLDSPAYEALRSALDFGPDWPSSGDAFASSSLLGGPYATDSLVTQGYDNSTGCYPSPDETSYLSLSTTNQSLPDTSLHEKPPVSDIPEEQAEEWNKTRAAKRVSLVKLPSDLRMTVISGKPSCHSHGDVSLKEELAGYRT